MGAGGRATGPLGHRANVSASVFFVVAPPALSLSVSESRAAALARFHADHTTTTSSDRCWTLLTSQGEMKQVDCIHVQRTRLNYCQRP